MRVHLINAPPLLERAIAEVLREYALDVTTVSVAGPLADRVACIVALNLSHWRVTAGPRVRRLSEHADVLVICPQATRSTAGDD